MKEFWSGERVAARRDGIEFRNAVMLPKPVPRPRPRLLIGGYVDKVLQRVAEKGDGWLTYFYEPESVQHGLAEDPRASPRRPAATPRS